MLFDSLSTPPHSRLLGIAGVASTSLCSSASAALTSRAIASAGGPVPLQLVTVRSTPSGRSKYEWPTPWAHTGPQTNEATCGERRPDVEITELGSKPMHVDRALRLLLAQVVAQVIARPLVSVFLREMQQIVLARRLHASSALDG